MKTTRNLLLLSFLMLLHFSLLHAQCVISLQPDPISGKDTKIWSEISRQNTNMGNDSRIESVVWTWGSSFGQLRALLEFDLSSLPSGCTVSNAQLVLHSENIPNSYHCGQNSSIHTCNSNELRIHRITESWGEMTATWNNQPTFASSTQGQDYVVVPNNDLPYNDYNIDITTMVNYWIGNPSQNNGMMIKLLDESTIYRSAKWASSDFPNPTLRPELILTLSCSSGGCSNKIEGYVFDDHNSDCIMNGSDQPLENWVVEVLPGPIFASTDSNGYYSTWVSDGSYTISQSMPNNHIWDSLCPMPYVHNVTVSGNTTVSADFGVEAEVYCPILTVDIASSFLRKCHTENFIVHYCNNGNITANGVYIDVNFSAGLSPLSSNATYSVLPSGDLSFPVGTLEPGDCATFYITTQVSCNANFGDIECVNAEIFPNYSCANPIPQDSSTWDRSSVMVRGYCNGDSLACFTILNTGSASNGNMLGNSTYRIYENNVLVHTGTFQLTGGANTLICWPTGLGNTIRLEADQRPGHPGNSHPNGVIENCGTQSMVTNTGSALPEDDVPPNVVQECAEVRSSYDPNDKQVIPSGVGTPHYVDQNIMLDYKIRFQNTGNDTAFTVIIRDTLSTALNINGIQIGSSSHDYTFSIEGNRVLVFTFNNIMLPDSNVNEVASHGFVKFKVPQVQDMPLGTVINNRASIYFDYNLPVLTNNTFLTIGDMKSILINAVIPTYKPVAKINVFPNPFSQSTTISITNYQGKEPIAFELFNALGVRVQSIISKETQFELQRKHLSTGVYFYRASTNNTLIGTGKISVD